MRTRRTKLIIGTAATAALALGVVAATWPRAPDRSPGAVFVVKRNGGWCWFQDERALLDGRTLIVGTIAGTSKRGSEGGEVEVSTLNLDGAADPGTHELAKLEADDHNSPSLVKLANGRYLAAYTRHAGDRWMRWRVSSAPGDASAWEPEQKLDVRAMVTYSNLHVLEGEGGRVYNFFRGKDNNPHFAVSDDEGTSFRLGGRLFRWQLDSPTAIPEKRTGRSNASKPYVRYAKGGTDTVHFITTEDHPRGYDNGIWHGYVRGGAMFDSHGRKIDEDIFDDRPPELTRLTQVFVGDRDNVAWTVDLQVGSDGHPVIAFSVQKDGQHRSSKETLGGLDHRYHYGRFDGTTWHVHEMAHAGTMLYEHEVNYTGLVAIVPRAPEVVFISTNADPVSGEALVSGADSKRHFELYRGETTDLGATWKWRAITRDSKVDQLRPIVPASQDETLVLWLRGRYRSMSAYELDVVGMFDPGG
jgi:hypothetical protein